MTNHEIGLLAIGFSAGILTSGFAWLYLVKSIIHNWTESNKRWLEHCRQLNQLWGDAMEELENKFRGGK